MRGQAACLPRYLVTRNVGQCQKGLGFHPFSELVNIYLFIFLSGKEAAA